MLNIKNKDWIFFKKSGFLQKNKKFFLSLNFFKKNGFLQKNLNFFFKFELFIKKMDFNKKKFTF